MALSEQCARLGGQKGITHSIRCQDTMTKAGDNLHRTFPTLPTASLGRGLRPLLDAEEHLPRRCESDRF